MYFKQFLWRFLLGPTGDLEEVCLPPPRDATAAMTGEAQATGEAKCGH